MRRRTTLLVIAVGLLAAGCPKGKQDYDQGRTAEKLQDYDAAYDYYQKALKDQPDNAEYLIKFNQARFEASTRHLKNGTKLLDEGNLDGAAVEFHRAATMDPSSPVAEQELRRVGQMIADKNHALDMANQPQPSPAENSLAALPPALKPLSHSPITYTASADAKVIFDTIGKLAGINVIYDPDFPARRISVNLPSVTFEQALDIASLEAKAFWKPITENTIMVIPDQPQKRRDYEEQVFRTFYLSNTVQTTDLTEIVTALRQMLDLKKIQPINALNAILIRDTPDKLAIAQKIIEDIDKAKPEVVIQINVIEARLDRMRDIGINPGTSGSISIVPPGTTTTTSGGTTNTGTSTTTTTNILTLQNLRHLDSTNTSVTVPNVTANALLSDSMTKLIQNPEIRSIDGQSAKLKIGDRVPVATGSFQAGVGVTAGATGINPLVNTQFQYIDVGTNVDVTPRVHPNHEISMKVSVEVSSVTGNSNIGGINQPIISQRKIEHDIRLREGESSILGGIISKSDVKSTSGWPGFANIPFLKYFFSDNSKSTEDDEILIILTPHIVRLPDWTHADERSLYTGSETNIQVRRESDLQTPVTTPIATPVRPAAAPQQAPPAVVPGVVTAPPSAATPPPATAQNAQAALLHFQPASLSLKVGQQSTIGLVVDNVNDLFSIPLLLQFNPAVLSVGDDMQQGGFLQRENQGIAIVARVDKEHGQAIISATRQPNTAGVSGSGTIMGIVVKGIAPGTSSLSIVQVNAKDSQQRPITLLTGEATVRVTP